MNYTVKDAFSKLPISYVGDNLKNWFFPMSFDKKKCKSLKSKKLLRAMNDEEIMKELNPGEVSMEEIISTLKTMDKSLHTLFYCKDKDGLLRTVFVYWFGVGWCAFAHAWGDDGWSGVYRVFSRQFLKPGKLESLTPASPESLEQRVAALEAWKNKVGECFSGQYHA